jgi:hypothetical protein
MALINIRTVSVPSVGKLPLAANPGTFTPSGEKRDHKAGRLAEDGGFTESATPAKLELNLNMLPGIDIQKINAIKGENVTIRMSDGQVHMMSLAFRSGEPVGFADGENKLTLMSNTSEKI